MASYVTLSGRNGEILGMYNPKGGPDGKERFISAEEIPQQGGINEPLRRGPLSTAELTRQGFLDQMLVQLDQVERQAGNNKESVGGLLGWRGTVSALKKKVGGSDPELQERGLAVTPEVADMLRTTESMKDALLRAKSGAQINEQEYKRLSKLVPDPSSASFWEDLSSLRNELKRLTEVTTGSDFNKETGRDKRKADKRYNPATGQFEEVKN